MVALLPDSLGLVRHERIHDGYRLRFTAAPGTAGDCQFSTQFSIGVRDAGGTSAPRTSRQPTTGWA